MSELQEAKRKLKEMKQERNHLSMEIRKQEGVVHALEEAENALTASSLGMREPVFKEFMRYVKRGVINRHGQYRHPAKINVAPIVRGSHHGGLHEAAEVYKPFGRNTYIELFHKRWRDGEGVDGYGKPTLAHSHQLNDEDRDYQRFLEVHDPLTVAEMKYIKSGRQPEGPEDEQHALDLMNHESR